ncbi:MAG: ankyrin repeat domain-containing protein [Gallionella sp.]|nr:ankyrin repeat domain-containing protein [Gallionella sp.]
MNEKMLRIVNNRPGNYPYALDQQFPRVMEKILAMWDMPEIDAYFVELMVSNRDKRQGFPKDVASDIVYLSMVHSRKKPTTAEINPWEEVTEVVKDKIESLGAAFSKKGFIKAAESGNREAITLFVSSGLDVDVCDERLWTPLMIAVSNGDEEMAVTLITAGANVHHVDTGGYTPLHWAAFNGHADVVALLLDRGADVNARSQHGWSSLLQAVTRGHLAVSATLLDRGADVNATTYDGWTALHKAAANGHAEEVALLLSRGADPHAKYKDGTQAIDLARKNKHEEIVKLLTKNS